MTPQDLFNQNFGAIQAFKTANPKASWEDAFHGVTGQNWQKGQGISIDHNASGVATGGHSQNDTSGWKKFAKIAIPIGAAVAAPFTGGASLALLGAGAGAATGAIDNGWKGALVGGAMGGVAGPALGKLVNGVGGGGGSFISDAIKGSAKSALDSGVGAGAAGGGGSAISKILGGVGTAVKGAGQKTLNSGPEGWSEAGKVLGGFAEGEANNRIARGNATQDYDRLMMQAETNKRTNESDALKKLAQTGYLQSGGRPYQASAAAPYTFGFGPKAPSAAQQQGAASLEGQLLDRLKPGGSYTPTPLDSYANRGTGENIANWGSLITSGIGVATDIFGNPIKSALQVPKKPQEQDSSMLSDDERFPTR